MRALCPLSGPVAWVFALVVGGAALAALDYRVRDPDSRLYAEIAARMSKTPATGWIAPDFPPGWYMSGPFREHPAGLFWPAALLARLGYPAPQAAFALNVLYQALTILLLGRLAAAFVDGLPARALLWLIQLIPVAFTFRIRANHEQAMLLCLVAALYGTDRSRARPAWAVLTAASLSGLLLVKGVLAVFGPALCVLWLVSGRVTSSGPATSDRAAWLGLAAAVVSMAVAAGVYELLYRQATGQPFWSFYLSRQLGVASVAQAGAGVARKAYNVVWYLGRVLWFPFPWSLTFLAAVWRTRRLPAGSDTVSTASASDGKARAGVLFAVATVVLYVGLFSLSDRRSDRYIFPAYYAVGAAGAVAGVQAAKRLRHLAERLDRPWLPAAVWLLTFAAHLFAGRLGLPTIKIWAPDT